jgi:hypothetical protein
LWIERRDYLLVCQHGSLWVSCAAAGELQIGYVVWTYYAIKDIKDVFRDTFCLMEELIVLDEAIMLAPYETHGFEIWEFRHDALIPEFL